MLRQRLLQPVGVIAQTMQVDGVIRAGKKPARGTHQCTTVRRGAGSHFDPNLLLVHIELHALDFMPEDQARAASHIIQALGVDDDRRLQVI